MGADHISVRVGEHRVVVGECYYFRRSRGIENDLLFGKSKRNCHSKVLLLLVVR